jgi:hypothetical protein
MKKSLLALAALCVAAMGAIASTVQAVVVGVAQKAHDSVTGYMARQGLLLCATVYSTEQTTLNGPMYGNAPATRVKANKQGGRIRLFEATYTVAGVVPIGDKIVWGKLPVRARVLGHLSSLSFAAGTAATTLNLGDNASAARHLAATAVNAAGTAVPNAQSASGASFETSDDTASVANAFVSATDDCTLISTVAGGTLLVGQVITLRIAYVCD